MGALDKDALFALVGYKPHEGQRAVHASAASRRVVSCGTRWGKTTLAVHEALAALLAPGPATRGWVVTPTAATTELLTDQLFALLRTHFAHRVVELDERERFVAVTNLAGNLAVVEGKTTDRPAALLGASLNWMVVDEAARVREDLWDTVLAPRLVDRGGWALVTSTPRGTNGWFRREHLRGTRREPGYASWTGPTWDNLKIAPEVVLAEKERLPLNTFLAEYAGQFVGERGCVCDACGWGRRMQRSSLSAREWRGLRRCDTCRRTLTAGGEPVGYEREDGGIGMLVLKGPEDEDVVAAP